MGLKSCQADVVIGAGPGEIGPGRCSWGGEWGEHRGRRNKGVEVAGKRGGVLQDSDAVLARLGQILLGWEVSLCRLVSHLHGYDLLKYHK